MSSLLLHLLQHLLNVDEELAEAIGLSCLTNQLIVAMCAAYGVDKIVLCRLEKDRQVSPGNLFRGSSR